MVKVCRFFNAAQQIKRQPLAYEPLVCKQPIVETKTITGRGLQNKQNYFFLMKPNTLREHATLDLLYPTPFWLRLALQQSNVLAQRITTQGEDRITTDDFLRVSQF